MKFNVVSYFPYNQTVPEYYAQAAPRFSARGREDDLLMLFIGQQGGEPRVGSALRQWQEKLASVFFKTSGSVTTGLRAVAESLNEALLKQNARLMEGSVPNTAELSLCVIHRDTLFIAQCGHAQAMLARAEGNVLFFDPELDALGLGAQSSFNIRFFQQAVKPGDWVVQSLRVPAVMQTAQDDMAVAGVGNWLGAMGEGLEPLALSRLEEGSNSVSSARFPAIVPEEPPSAEMTQLIEGETEEPELEEDSEELEIMDSEDGEVLEEETFLEEEAEYDQDAEFKEIDMEEDGLLPEEETSLAQDLFGNIPIAPDVEEPVSSTQSETPSEPETTLEPAPEVDQEPTQAVNRADISTPLEAISETEPQEPKQPNPEVEKLKQDALLGVAKGARFFRKLEDKAEAVINTGDTSLASATAEQPPADTGLSGWGKLIIAILVPLFVVGIAAMIYTSRGRTDEFDHFLAQAQVAAANAEGLVGTSNERQAWNETLNWVRQAQVFGSNADLNALQTKAQNALDNMDGAVRLVYRPAFNASLYPGLEIGHVISLNNDLYVLDKASGKVLHFALSNQGFSENTSFQCGPGTYDGVTVGQLAFMTTIPINNPAKAPILAMDAEGATLYCSLRSDPVASQLVAPDGGFGRIQSMTYDAGRLFLLDPESNALWIYRGFASQFSQPPDSYFDNQPVKLAEAVDAAVGGDELFVLYSDGHTSHCLASNVLGTVDCQDPYLYHDTRQGVPPLDFLSMRFGQLSYSPPPDPSIYYLEPELGELYQFSLRLNLNRMLRAAGNSGVLPNKPVTAFDVSSNRQVFLAYGNELFYAIMP